MWTEAGEPFAFGDDLGQLGHDLVNKEQEPESCDLPRLVEALAGKKVIGVSAGGCHTVAWTDIDAGELFTFGKAYFHAAISYGMLGHGVQEDERLPRLVEALGGKKVIGAAAGTGHTAVWTEAGELFTFGHGGDGTLGHGGIQNELVPTLVEAMAGENVIGAAVGEGHTVVWTDEGELSPLGMEPAGSWATEQKTGPTLCPGVSPYRRWLRRWRGRM